MSEKNLLEIQLQQAKAGNLLLTLLIGGKHRITGKVRAFDNHMVVLQGGQGPCLVYRHAISRISIRGTAQAPARQRTASRETEPTRQSRAATSRMEKKPAGPPKQATEQPADKGAQLSGTLPGALGEELRKWLKNSGM